MRKLPIEPGLQSAIDAVLLAGQEQLHWLDRNPHPPLDASLTEAVAFYGGPRAALSLWTMCKSVEELRLALVIAVNRDELANALELQPP